MMEPYTGKSRIVNMIKSCCVHHTGGVPCGEGTAVATGWIIAIAIPFLVFWDWTDLHYLKVERLAEEQTNS